ncbi:MAG: type II toxin-antitoxin system RelE/ParE family toxin [Patescibacteria group bacterium]
MKDVIIQPRAESDLFEQWAYIDKDNPEAADRFTEQAMETFRLIATMPLIGTFYESPNPQLQSLRKFPVQGFEQHLIFYAPSEDRIEIVRVLHSKRDLEGVVGEK